MGITANRATAVDNTWSLWQEFCAALNQDAYLRSNLDPVPWLFAQCYRTGIIAPSGSPVRSRTVEGALRAIGQTFASLGRGDPRLQSSGRLDLRLQRQLKAYAKQDPPPARVKPIPFSLIAHAAHLCRLADSPRSHAIADMLILGFYFLLCPGEYAWTDNPDSSPFRFCDIHLIRGTHHLNLVTTTELDIRSATAVALEFTEQRNGTRGELVGLTRSDDPQWCPVLAIINRILHFRLYNAPPHTPLYLFFHLGAWNHIAAPMLTEHLRNAAYVMGEASGTAARDIWSVPYAPRVPWHSYVRLSILTSFDSLAAGVQMKCYATSTYKLFPLLPLWQPRCSNMAISP
jgi:hypothetical protein